MPKQAPERKCITKVKEIIDLPNLIEIQVKSYQNFLQLDLLPEERHDEGLQRVFNEIFPIRSFDEKVLLEFKKYHLSPPKYEYEESIKRGISYASPLKATFRLTDETGIKEEEVYLGTLPLMTDRGTFVINGAERVVVSQLHRSPGLSFEKARHPRGTTLFSFRIIPYRGSWLEASFDINDLIYFYVDKKKRRKKLLITTFLRTLGYSSDNDIIEEFFETRKCRLKSESDAMQHVGSILADDVIDEETGVLYGKASEKLSTAMVKRILDAKIKHVKVIENATEEHPILKMLAKDPTDSYEAALKDFYRKIRPGEPPTIANARSLIMRMFFDPKRYNLGRVGRYKINNKFGLPLDDDLLNQVTLRKEDIIEAVKYLIRLKMGDQTASIDDIDHLSNRRVRSVGELVQNQCRVGFLRMEKVIRERINLFDFSQDTLTPGKVMSSKGLQSVIKEFFGRSQLSQFMEQTNPVAELTHKRRLSSLGPGGLNRDRAGFEVRDVHTSHYGRICPIETPEGPNIGLITSLSAFAKINEFGFIETPYRIVRDGIVTEEIEYMTADQEERCTIAQASALLDEHNMFKEDTCWARFNAESLVVETSQVTHMDVSPKQLVSVVTSLIPFLEHDDANRALMGSNMQRQAVPLLKADAPVVGTGVEKRIAIDSGAVVVASESGIVEYVDGYKIIVASEDNPAKKKEYVFKKYLRSNTGTCINQIPLVKVGEKIDVGDIIADGQSTDKGEIALGKNVTVAFMPWYGYNYEDAIIISEELTKNDAFTSIYIQEFELTARDTKLGTEEITRDIPNVADELLSKLNDDGIIAIGSEVKSGDILVGKVTPKSETELSPEERLLRAIFGEKASDVKDASLVAPPGTEGVVMDIKVFSRRDKLSKSEEELVEEKSNIKEIQKTFVEKELELRLDCHEKLGALLLKKPCSDSIYHKKSGEEIFAKGSVFTQDFLELLEDYNLEDLIFPQTQEFQTVIEILKDYHKEKEVISSQLQYETEHVKKGDIELDAGVISQVKVYIATKRKLQVGDKMAGRHGNKGVVSTIVPQADMPYLEDGTPVQIILNPLGVPSRMNLGQMLETHLGYAAQKEGVYVQAPVFEGFPEEEIWKMFEKNNLPVTGKQVLYDGYTGQRFDNPVVVGTIYMLKLSHLVADKIHARSIGPYSLVTQQPLGGKAQRGGQRFGEMEVWALEAYGASNILQELLTVKSDDVEGRTNIYKSIVNGSNILNASTPESFNVLVKEIQGLGLDVALGSKE